MLTIRLQRTGTKNKPAFRIVLAQAHTAASKKFLEVLGHYNPVAKDFAIKNEERLKYWLAQRVKLSPTVHNLLVEKKLLDEKKMKAWKPKRKVQAEGEPATVTSSDTSKAEQPSVSPEPAVAEKPAEKKSETPEPPAETTAQ